MINNLITFSNNASLSDTLIYIINQNETKDFHPINIKGAVTEKVFYYRPQWNFYYTCKRLKNLLPQQNTVLVAHDWLELGMASNLGLDFPIVHIVHGDYDYYYELARKHQDAIDSYIAISPVIFDKLKKLLPGKSDSIFYRRFPVPKKKKKSAANNQLKIFFCVRSLLDHNKQFELLPLINELLIKAGIPVHWTIVGTGIAASEIKKLMKQADHIDTYDQLENAAILQLIREHDIFLLPSLNEGFPVSLVEAMKAGVVPLATNWNNATGELLINGETGFYCEKKNPHDYAARIMQLSSDRVMLQKLSDAASEKANQLFDPHTNTSEKEKVFVSTADKKRKKYPKKVYGSRLDHPFIPNFFTSFVREF